MSKWWNFILSCKPLRSKPARLLLAAAVSVGLAAALLVPATMSASSATASKPSATTKSAVPSTHKGLEVSQTTMVLDSAGARCPTSADVTKCPVPLVPVHSPIGTQTYNTTYAPNEFGEYAAVRTNDPTIPIGQLLPQQVRLGGHGMAMPAHTFYQSTGWHHFPCYCLGGKILQSLQVHAFEFCTYFSGCPVRFGQFGAYGLNYIQQIYGAFIQPWHLAIAYADANYWSGASFRAGGHVWASYFSDGNPGQSGFHYVANTVMGLDACENPGVGGPGYVNYAGDQMFTGEGDYTEAGWIDDFPMSCITGFPGLTNDTHMAT